MHALISCLVTVLGANISEYLLEKSRVVLQQSGMRVGVCVCMGTLSHTLSTGEENFHVFYYMFASPQAATLHLDRPEHFEYTLALPLCALPLTSWTQVPGPPRHARRHHRALPGAADGNARDWVQC